MSIDGYIAGPNGEMDWMIWDFDDKLKKYIFESTEFIRKRKQDLQIKNSGGEHR